MTQFKDKSAKRRRGHAPSGCSPTRCCMAADILLYDADQVPVGEDQRQHLELTRDLAQRFNHRYGEDLRRCPSRTSSRRRAKITDLQDPTAKMSKSAPRQAGIIELLDDPKVIAKKIRSAVTDSGARSASTRPEAGRHQPADDLLRADRPQVADLEKRLRRPGYGDLKKDLADVVVEFVTPFRDRTLELLDDPAELDGSSPTAPSGPARWPGTLRDVYERVGFAAPARRAARCTVPTCRDRRRRLADPRALGDQLQRYRGLVR